MVDELWNVVRDTVHAFIDPEYGLNLHLTISDLRSFGHSQVNCALHRMLGFERVSLVMGRPPHDFAYRVFQPAIGRREIIWNPACSSSTSA